MFAACPRCVTLRRRRSRPARTRGSFWAAVVLTFSAVAARADIEFVGILATSQSTQFALADTATGRTDWVQAGGKFAGYTVEKFEPKEDTVLLRREGQELRVRLKDDAKVKSARIELTGMITFGTTEKLEIERATLQYDQENVFPLKEGVTYRITPQRLPDGTLLYHTAIERSLGPNKNERISAPGVTARPGQQFTLRIAEFAFSFQPR
jgi:hypothetical protein